MRLFLIGFMGCGKSYWAGQLSGILSVAATDLDQAIAAAAGMSIPEIFQTRGEAGFRLLEREALHATLAYTDRIIATGGGAPCFFDNMDWMNAAGITVYLQASPALLAERLQKEQSDRPLIRDLAPDALETFIEAKLAEREVFYRQAAFTIDAGQSEAAILAQFRHILSQPG